MVAEQQIGYTESSNPDLRLDRVDTVPSHALLERQHASRHSRGRRGRAANVVPVASSIDATPRNPRVRGTSRRDSQPIVRYECGDLAIEVVSSNETSASNLTTMSTPRRAPRGRRGTRPQPGSPTCPERWVGSVIVEAKESSPTSCRATAPVSSVEPLSTMTHRVEQALTRHALGEPPEIGCFVSCRRHRRVEQARGHAEQSYGRPAAKALGENSQAKPRGSGSRRARGRTR